MKHAKACLCHAGYRNPKTRNKRQVSNQQAAIQTLFQDYKLRAKRLKIDWSLTREQFEKLILSPCHYCGCTNSNKHTKTYEKVGDMIGCLLYNGLDKKRPNGEYVSDNVLACCWPCNRAKGLLTYEEFLAYVRRIFERTNGLHAKNS